MIPIRSVWFQGSGQDLIPWWDEWREEMRNERVIWHVTFAGWFRLSSPLDLTGFRGMLKELDCSRAVLWADFTSEDTAAFDMSGSSGITITNLTLRTTKDQRPAFGILECRSMNPRGTGKSSGKHVFNNCKVEGTWGVAALYNVAAEGDIWVGGDLLNDGGQCTAFWGKAATVPLRSKAELVPSGVSASTLLLQGTRFEDYGGEGRAALVFDGFRYVHSDNVRVYSVDKPHLGLFAENVNVLGHRHRGLYLHGTQGGYADPCLVATGKRLVNCEIDVTLSHSPMVFDLGRLGHSSIRWASHAPVKVTPTTHVDGVQFDTYSAGVLDYQHKDGDVARLNGELYREL